jgi:hypothetical protein
MKKTTAITTAIILIGIFAGSANACEPFMDLDKVGCFDDTPNYPLVDNHNIWNWFGYKPYSGKRHNYDWSGTNTHNNWFNWSWGNYSGSNDNYWKWNFCKWNDNPCNDGGGEIPEPTCTVLTLAGTGVLCLLRRKK